MTESTAPDPPDGYLEACRVDAEALLACVVFAVHHPSGGDPPPDLASDDQFELDERLRAFMEFDEGDEPTGRWRR